MNFVPKYAFLALLGCSLAMANEERPGRQPISQGDVSPQEIHRRQAAVAPLRAFILLHLGTYLSADRRHRVETEEQGLELPWYVLSVLMTDPNLRNPANELQLPDGTNLMELRRVIFQALDQLAPNGVHQH
jgi:hypothetical protein